MFEYFGVGVLLRAEQRKPKIPLFNLYPRILSPERPRIAYSPEGLYPSSQLRSQCFYSSWDERDGKTKDPGHRNALCKAKSNTFFKDY